jgi:hypothetical protein
MKFASIRAAGEALYGAVTEAGFIALSPKLPTMGDFDRGDPSAGPAAAGASG